MDTVGLLVFTIGDARFALAATVVREVVRSVAVAPLPKAPAIVEGVVNYRGAIVPLLDVRGRFRLPGAALDPAQHFIIANAGPRTVALRVDRATELIRVNAESIHAASATVPGTDYVAGIARLPDGLLVIHDLERFLALDEAEQLDRALTSGAAEAGARLRGARS